MLADFITDSSCVELCFGDTLVAAQCNRRHIRWTGFDINEYFVTCARKKGFDAQHADLETMEVVPSAGVVLMSGSLYHFHETADLLVKKMIEAAPKVVISEPVKNLSSAGGLFGKLAGSAASTQKGRASFRYNRETFLELMNRVARETQRKLTIEKEFKKDLIISLTHA
jgi:uncharacterized protein YlzI (FlbEa/FlbD family)